MTIVIETPATPATQETADIPGNSAGVSIVTNTGGGGVTIRWWGSGEGAVPGSCLLGWVLLVVLGRMLVGELAVVGLALVLVAKQRGSEKLRAMDEGSYRKGVDHTRREEREGKSWRKLGGGRVATEVENAKDSPKFPNRLYTPHILLEEPSHYSTLFTKPPKPKPPDYSVLFEKLPKRRRYSVRLLFDKFCHATRSVWGEHLNHTMTTGSVPYYLPPYFLLAAVLVT